MFNDWVKVYSSRAIHLIEIVKSHLEDEYIKTFIINKTDSMYVNIFDNEIELYVKSDQALKAKHLINKHHIE